MHQIVLDSSPFGIRDRESVAVMIDGPSFYSSHRTLGFEVDYGELLLHFQSWSLLRFAGYYTTITETEGYNPLRPLTDWLALNGFRTCVKQGREVHDAGGRRRVFGNCLIELSVDLANYARSVEHIVLFTGEGDLTYAVDNAQRSGTRVTVVSIGKGDFATACAERLRRQADRFVELNDVRFLFESKRKADVKDAVVSQALPARGSGDQPVPVSAPVPVLVAIPSSRGKALAAAHDLMRRSRS